MSSLTPEAYAVIEGRPSDPFHYLGPHVEMTGQSWPWAAAGRGGPQTWVASSGGRSGSSSHRSLPASTQTQVTTCCQSTSGFRAGCSSLQIQRPGARSMTSTLGNIRSVIGLG